MTEALPVPLPAEDEKTKIAASTSSASPSTVPNDIYIDPAIEKRVIRKCDLRVVPPTLILFMLSFLDRVNIGNAAIQGLPEDLALIGHQFNVALLILFIPFILLEIPSNLVMKRLDPSTWLSVLLFGCGIMNMCMGFVNSYGALVGVRFLLGIFEAGLGPGSIYLISMYYRRYELPWRLSWWYCSGIIAGCFGGLLAYAIAHMDGIQGYSGWRWIFILEGLLTAVVGIVMKWWLVDWPEDAKFLTEEERAILIARLSQDRTQDQPMSRWDTRRVLGDWKIWLGTLMFFGIVNTNYSTNFFMPTILVEMGYDSISAQVHTIPIYAVAAVFCLAFCFISDRVKHRYGFIMFGVLVGSIGYILLLCQRTLPIGAKYFALFTLVTCGYIVQPLSVAWMMNNMGGHYKRAFASAAQIGWGNAGGIIASNVYFDSETPYFTTGYGISFALLLMTGVIGTVMFFLLKRENRNREDGKKDYLLQAPDSDNLGDEHPHFIYAY